MYKGKLYMEQIVILFFSIFALTSCVTPGEEAERSYELIRLDKTYNPKQCRIACDNAMKSFNPLTGECKCYPPEYTYKKKRKR